MPAAYVRCEICNGSRYARKPSTSNIEEGDRRVLELSVAEAIEFFPPIQKIRRAHSKPCATQAWTICGLAKSVRP